MTERGATFARLVAASSLAVALMLGATDARAQANQGQGPSSPLLGFSQNRDQPVKIKSATLEFRDKDKVATFSGDVHVTQGDTDLRCKVLIVHYDSGPGGAAPAGKSGPGPQAQIRRMVARGGVVVTQKDQTATGDTGEFDMRANIVTLTGNVVVTRGQDVLRGQRLTVNLTTGVTRMESAEGLIQGTPGSGPKPGQGQPPRPARPN